MIDDHLGDVEDHEEEDPSEEAVTAVELNSGVGHEVGEKNHVVSANLNEPIVEEFYHSSLSGVVRFPI